MGGGVKMDAGAGWDGLLEDGEVIEFEGDHPILFKREYRAPAQSSSTSRDIYPVRPYSAAVGRMVTRPMNMDAVLVTSQRLLFVRGGRIKEAFGLDTQAASELQTAIRHGFERDSVERQQIRETRGRFRAAFTRTEGATEAAQARRSLSDLRLVLRVAPARHWVRPLKAGIPSLLMGLVLVVVGSVLVPQVWWLVMLLVVGGSIALRAKSWTGVRFLAMARRSGAVERAQNPWPYEIFIAEQEQVQKFLELMNAKVTALQEVLRNDKPES